VAESQTLNLPQAVHKLPHPVGKCKKGGTQAKVLNLGSHEKQFSRNLFFSLGVQASTPIFHMSEMIGAIYSVISFAEAFRNTRK
jgi:hypothetical protein